MPWVLKKCYWVIWGGDLYAHNPENLTRQRNKLDSYIRRSVIKNLGYLVTYIRGDYELAKKWLGCKGEFQECLMYTTNLYRELKKPVAHHSETNILVGNSASYSNNHFEIFKNLSDFRRKKNQNIHTLNLWRQSLC